MVCIYAWFTYVAEKRVHAKIGFHSGVLICGYMIENHPSSVLWEKNGELKAYKRVLKKKKTRGLFERSCNFPLTGAELRNSNATNVRPDGRMVAIRVDSELPPCVNNWLCGSTNLVAATVRGGVV